MITFPNAKINLGLNIVSKRADGYHNLETIFYPIPLKDVIEVTTNTEHSGLKSFQLTQYGHTISGDDTNDLVVKAYLLLKDKYNLPPIDIAIYKSIPFGAGLGGGSADCAFTLKLLSEYLQLNLTTRQLETYAASLGADCAFFIENKPVFAKGIGNLFTPIDLDLSDYDIYLHKPNIFVSTAEAFSKITPTTPKVNLQEIIKMPIETWKELMINDFEKSVFTIHPQLEKIKYELYECGALYAAMSGSGSSIFGIFTKGSCPLTPNRKANKYLLPL